MRQIATQLYLSQLSAARGGSGCAMPRPMFDAFSYSVACAKLATDACVALVTEGSLTKEDGDRIIDAVEGGDATLLASASSMAETHPAWFVERACKRLKLREFSGKQQLALPAPTDAIAPATQQPQLPPPPDLTTVVQTHHNDSTTVTALIKNGVELERRIHVLPPETQTAPPLVNLTDEPIANTENDLLVSKARGREDLELYSEKRKEDLICGVCKFRAKSVAGLKVHMRSCLSKKSFPNSGRINDGEEELDMVAASTLTAIQCSQHGDGFADDLMGDSEDRRRLADMSELERERILTERSDARKAMETRSKVMAMAAQVRSKRVASPKGKKKHQSTSQDVDESVAWSKIIDHFGREPPPRRRFLPTDLAAVIVKSHLDVGKTLGAQNVQDWWHKNRTQYEDRRKQYEADEDEEYEQLESESDEPIEYEGYEELNEYEHTCKQYFDKINFLEDGIDMPSNSSWQRDLRPPYPTIPQKILDHTFDGAETNGLVHLIKGGRRPSHEDPGTTVYTWLYFPRKFADVVAEAEEYVKDVGVDNVEFILPLVKNYGEFGRLVCSKKGTNKKTVGVCFTRPCERCWPYLQKWEQSWGGGAWKQRSRDTYWKTAHLHALTGAVGEYIEDHCNDNKDDDVSLRTMMDYVSSDSALNGYTVEDCIVEYRNLLKEHTHTKAFDNVLVKVFHRDGGTENEKPKEIYWPARIYSIGVLKECYHIKFVHGKVIEGYYVQTEGGAQSEPAYVADEDQYIADVPETSILVCAKKHQAWRQYSNQKDAFSDGDRKLMQNAFESFRNATSGGE